LTRIKLSTRRLIALALAALLVPLVVAVSPAAAADPDTDPAATLTRVFRSGGPFPRTIGMNARVRSDAGVPAGTITFYEVGDPTPVDDPIPVDATGLASTYVGTPAGPSPEPVFYRAVFHATGGFADSEGTEGDGGALVVDPEPTILGIGGPLLLKLPLTTSAYIRRADGVPEEGTIVYFSQYGSVNSDNPKVKMVCVAIADINGLATCKGEGAGPAVLSVLGAGVWATAVDYANLVYVEQRLPVIKLGK
jgi:hypothetical protein